VSHQRIPIIVHLNCVCLQEEGYKQWLESSNVYLDQDHVPFDVQVYETALGVYEITVWITITRSIIHHSLVFMLPSIIARTCTKRLYDISAARPPHFPLSSSLPLSPAPSPSYSPAPSPLFVPLVLSLAITFCLSPSHSHSRGRSANDV